MKAYRRFFCFFLISCLFTDISLYCGRRYGEIVDIKTAQLISVGASMAEAENWERAYFAAFVAGWLSIIAAMFSTPLQPWWERVILTLIFALAYPMVVLVLGLRW